MSTVPLGLRGPVPPDDRGGAPMAWSLAGHAVTVALLLWALREAAPPPLPPSYAVSLVAAPPGPRTEATSPVPAPVPTPAANARPRPEATAMPSTPPSRTATSIAPPVTPPTPRSRDARPTPATSGATATPASTKATASKTSPTPSTTTTTATSRTTGAPATGAERTARGGATAGAGTDVATVRTDGIAFPYPGYLENIVRQVALNFRPRAGITRRADVAFTIQRDGTVSDIRLVTRSGDYAFDLECLGAVEAVAGGRGFGPLPRGFGDDALPVVFSFDPRTLR